MGDKLKYKKGDRLANGRGKILGKIVKAEKSQDTDNKTNKYDVEKLDGTIVSVIEHQIIETKEHKDKI